MYLYQEIKSVRNEPLFQSYFTSFSFLRVTLKYKYCKLTNGAAQRVSSTGTLLKTCTGKRAWRRDPAGRNAKQRQQQACSRTHPRLQGRKEESPRGEHSHHKSKPECQHVHWQRCPKAATREAWEASELKSWPPTHQMPNQEQLAASFLRMLQKAFRYDRKNQTWTCFPAGSQQHSQQLQEREYQERCFVCFLTKMKYLLLIFKKKLLKKKLQRFVWKKVVIWNSWPRLGTHFIT